MHRGKVRSMKGPAGDYITVHPSAGSRVQIMCSRPPFYSSDVGQLSLSFQDLFAQDFKPNVLFGLSTGLPIFVSYHCADSPFFRFPRLHTEGHTCAPKLLIQISSNKIGRLSIIRPGRFPFLRSKSAQLYNIYDVTFSISAGCAPAGPVDRPASPQLQRGLLSGLCRALLWSVRHQLGPLLGTSVPGVDDVSRAH